MSAAQQAKARRSQMVNNYSHLCPRQRPNYKKRDLATATAHEARVRVRENERRQRTKKK